MTKFIFDVTLDDLLEADGVEGLNNILEERMLQNPEFEGVLPTDISYEPQFVTPGDIGLITIIATFTPDSIYGETDEEDDEDGTDETD